MPARLVGCAQFVDSVFQGVFILLGKWIFQRLGQHHLQQLQVILGSNSPEIVSKAAVDILRLRALAQVCLSVGRHVRNVERVLLSGCAYHLAGMCAVLCAVMTVYSSSGALIVWQAVGLSFGRHARSAEHVFLSGRAGHLALVV